MIELPMSLREYDTILASIRKDEEHYAYGDVTACILAGRFQEVEMPIHATLLRTSGTSGSHPFYCFTVRGSIDSFIAASHHYGVLIRGPLDEVILEATND